MKPKTLLANISRKYFEKKNIIRYRMKKTEDMSDTDIINSCHWSCEGIVKSMSLNSTVQK